MEAMEARDAAQRLTAPRMAPQPCTILLQTLAVPRGETACQHKFQLSSSFSELIKDKDLGMRLRPNLRKESPYTLHHKGWERKGCSSDIVCVYPTAMALGTLEWCPA